MRSLPPCVGFGYMQSVCYGWMTDKRMKTYPCRPCVFGCTDHMDCFYHYASCPIIWSAMSSIGIVGHRPIDSKLRFLLVLDRHENIVLRLAFVHACMISVHKLRGPHHFVPIVNRQRYIRSNFRDIVSRSKTLKDSYRALGQRVSD